MQDITILFQTYLILLAMSLIVVIALAIARLLHNLGIINIKEEYIDKLSYNTRGIYFIPMRTDYSNMLYLFPKNNKNIQKLPPVKKKIIFRIMKTMKPDVYELYLKDDENLIKKGVALVQNIELSHKLFGYFENKEQIDEVKVECRYDQKFQKWIPVSKSDEEISSIYDLPQ